MGLPPSRDGMKASPECFECLRGLAEMTIELATEDPSLKLKARDAAKEVLSRFSLELIPTQVSTEFLRAIKRITGNPDPYREWKAREAEIARRVVQDVRPLAENFRGCVEFAALGNVFDFFMGVEHLKRAMGSKPRFVIDHVSLVEQSLEHVKRILYLSDNTGEAFFDLPLVRELEKRGEVVYAVKGGPVQNDLTLDDLRNSGLIDEFKNVITIGTDSVGVDFQKVSREFLGEFERADLVISKGMGNYETLSELHPEGRIFYILKAKCGPVARSLGVELDSYVAMLR